MSLADNDPFLKPRVVATLNQSGLTVCCGHEADKDTTNWSTPDPFRYCRIIQMGLRSLHVGVARFLARNVCFFEVERRVR